VHALSSFQGWALFQWTMLRAKQNLYTFVNPFWPEVDKFQNYYFYK